MDASDQPLPGVVPTPPPAQPVRRAARCGGAVRSGRSRVVYVNPAFERATAIARSTCVGRTLDEVEGLRAVRGAVAAMPLRDVLETEQERWFKFRFDHPLGRRHFDVRLLLESATQRCRMSRRCCAM